MEIYRHSDAKTIEKKLGTQITYHLFDEYEVNVNIIPPNSSQDWHFHKIKEEVILVIDGSIDVEWKENEQEFLEKLSKGDLVRVEKSPHRFVNSYSEECRFICFKLVLSGKNQRETLAGDKYPA
ncbi:MAG: cupin domain-containing protein [Candidatus Gottesmanbacteria bacterium]